MQVARCARLGERLIVPSSERSEHMSSQDKLSLDDYVVKEFTSVKDERFVVAYPKAAGYTVENLETDLTSFADEDEARAAVSDDSWIDVHWPLGFFSGVYGFLDQKVFDLGIADVSVGYYEAVWKYRLGFRNTKGWGFQFKDATGDVYRILTTINGWHYLLYNSSDPTIVGVK
jgi:hypothetical protein